MAVMRRLILASVFALGAAPIASATLNEIHNARHVLSLEEVNITDFISDVAVITGYTFIMHPDVGRTKVSVMSQTAMPTEELFQVFLATLRVHGFTAVPAGKDVYRIVPEQTAIGGAAIRGDGPNEFVTQVFSLNHFSATEAAQMVKPLIDPQGQVVANARSNTLVLVDYRSNIPRLSEIISGLDVDNRTQVQTIELRNVPAREIQTILEDLMGGRDTNSPDRFEVSASISSNAIILRGDDASLARASMIARSLDETDPVKDSLRVIELKNATAEDIVPILERLAETMATQVSRGEVQASSATISHHQPTNSLILSAPPDMILAMERVVEALDRRRAQVFLEAIIVEISDDSARDLGIQFLLARKGNSASPFLSTNFSNSAPSLLQLAGAIANPDIFGGSNPFTEGAVGSLIGQNGIGVGAGAQSGDNLFGAIVNALETDEKSVVLSKPFNMTLDNGRSELLVGQQIPVATGESLGSDNGNPFRTVTRQDIGIKLNVTPRITADDTIHLEIFQEVSSIAPTLTNGADDFVTNLRQITTSVLADNGEIIVLGGLIEQSQNTINQKVPIAGDVPVLGNLFKDESTQDQRSNLMVFIRPTIVRDQKDAQEVAQRSYRYIHAEDLLNSVSKGNKVSELDSFFEDVLELDVTKTPALRGRIE